MLNEEKIKLMTKAASFEGGEGKKALAMNKYFRGDYISLHLLAAWVSYTITFCLGVAVWGFYNMDDFMDNIYKMDLPAMGKDIASLYVGLLVVYLIMNYVIFHIRYRQNRKKLAAYHHILKKISHIYQMESKNGNGGLTSGGTKRDDDFTGI